MNSKPDDATLIAVRNRYGPGSILRLSDDVATRSFAQPMAEAMVAAARKYATRPERVTQFINDLTRTSEEQDYAVAICVRLEQMPSRSSSRHLATPTFRPMRDDSLSATWGG